MKPWMHVWFGAVWGTLMGETLRQFLQILDEAAQLDSTRLALRMFVLLVTFSLVLSCWWARKEINKAVRGE